MWDFASMCIYTVGNKQVPKRNQEVLNSPERVPERNQKVEIWRNGNRNRNQERNQKLRPETHRINQELPGSKNPL